MPIEVSEFSVSPLKEGSKYIKSYRLKFLQNGKTRCWDGILSHDSVSILIFHTAKKSLLFVKQFRPVVYYSKIREVLGRTGLEKDAEPLNVDSTIVPASHGETLELCAGLIDGSDADPAKVAVQEIFEECGYQVHERSLRKIDRFHSSLGLIGSHMTMYYTEVDESHLVPGAGGGLHEEGEVIELIEWPIAKLDELLNPNPSRPSTSPSLLYALCWFKMNILPGLQPC